MLVNRVTGKEPTSEELEAIKQRAKQILNNPYASWEQLEWAMMVYPEGLTGAPYETVLNNPLRGKQAGE